MKLERLTVGEQTAQLVVNDLRQALKTATATEALLIIPMIGRAVALQHDIKALGSAIATPEKEKAT